MLGNKILGSLVLGSLAFGVSASSVIPEVNYNENVTKTKLAMTSEVKSRAVKANDTNKIIFNENTKFGFLMEQNDDMPIPQSYTVEAGQYFLYPTNSYKYQFINSLWFDIPGIDKLPANSYTKIIDDVTTYDMIFSPEFGEGEPNFIDGFPVELKSEAFELFESIQGEADGITLVQAKTNITLNSSLVNGDNPGASIFILVDYIKDNQGPSLQFPTEDGTNNFIVNVNNMQSIEDILSHVTATDETDGKLEVQYDTNETTYNPANKQTGKFVIKAYAQDKSGNRTNLDITVTVADIDKPVISGTSTYTRSYDNPITLDEVKQGLIVSDNYDNGLELQVVSDNYTGNERVLGSKTITFKAVDSSGNTSEIYTVTINVTDNKAPVITGPGEVKVSNANPITLDEFKTKFTATDDLENNVSITITGFDAYEKDKGKVQTHVITLKAEDSSGNEVSKTVNLIVEDRIAPDIMLDNYFIVLSKGEELTAEQIREYAAKALGISTESIAEVTGSYDTSVVGEYSLSVRTVTGETYKFNLSVNENFNNYEERELEWYEYIYKWFPIFFNFDGSDYYRTDSFWDFGARCSKLGELYSTGKYYQETEEYKASKEEAKEAKLATISDYDIILPKELEI